MPHIPKGWEFRNLISPLALVSLGTFDVSHWLSKRRGRPTEARSLLKSTLILQVEVTESVLSKEQRQTIRMFRHLSFMVMLLMQLEKRDEAPDPSRSERHEARVYIQHCCESVEKRWERQKTLCTVNCVTLGYRAFWPVWKKTVRRQTGTKRYHVIRSHGGICSSTFQTHGKIWRFH